MKHRPQATALSWPAILWVIVALSISMFPQLINMPAQLVPITLLPVAWRLLAQARNWKPMSIWARILATGFAISALLLSYGQLLGRRVAVSMLVMMLALKLLEAFRVRDARIVASLSLFLCATQFLFYQGVAMIAYIIACLLSALTALLYLHRQEAFEGLREAPATGRNLFTELGFGLRLIMLALPIGLALFLLFPRWNGPLWGIPEGALDARSGLSDSMSPGSIQNLFMDDSPAFRAEFKGPLPQYNKLYWRGPVFWDFDGRSWRSGFFGRSTPATVKPDPGKAVFRYSVQLEPTEQRWLFALDYPALEPRDTQLSMDYQLISKQPITQLRSYNMASDPGFIDSLQLRITLRKAALELPPGFNPKTAKMMAKWRQEATSDAEIIRRALAYFNQQEFHYTLNPALLSRHTVDEFLFETRRGFCEHYASTFTIMMRLAGIPARIVTGYMGGWYSDLGGYLLIRQSDAHAWSEVWLAGRGWVRVDPTAAVAPERVERGSMSTLIQRRHMLDFEWLRNARNTFDLLQRGWNNWAISFGSERQSRLFDIFGWGIFDSVKLVIAMLAIILIVGTVIFLILPLALRFRSSRQQDPLLHLWQRFIKKLVKAGLNPRPSMGPQEVAAMASGQLSYAATGIDRITELYTLCRYSSDTAGQPELARLIHKLQLRSS